MRRLPLLALLLLLVVPSGACWNRICTAMYCGDHITFQLPEDQDRWHQPHLIEVCIGDQCQRMANAMQPDSPPGPLHGRISGTPTLLQWAGEPELLDNYNPVSLQVTEGVTGRVVFEFHGQVEWDVREPNGRGCGFCRSAIVDLRGG